MIDLERALTDLADHLDYPARDDAADALRRRLVAPVADLERHRRTRVLLAAAAVLIVVATGVVTIAPARHAVADWLGIGAVEIRRTDSLPAPRTSTSVLARGDTTLHAARGAVRFRITTPSRDSAGVLTGVSVDRRVPGGLVALAYERLTLFEIATDPAKPFPLSKLVGNDTPIEHVTVDGRPGAWIAGLHEIGYIDRAGQFATDTVRTSGPVLLWERAGVTYRIEGLRSLDEAQEVAATLR